MSRHHSANPLRTVRLLSIASLITTYLLLVLGSTVRVTNSGMGCQGWPLCSGRVGPISAFHPLMEQAHRFLATLVTVLIIALAASVLRAGSSTRHVRVPAFTAVGFLVIQIVLGAVTVVTNNAPVTVALHLVVAVLFLGVVTIAAAVSFLEPNRSWSSGHPISALARAAVAGLFLMVISGSIVVDAGAQGACQSWPLCPPSSVSLGLVVIQFIHRSMVLGGSILVVAYLVNRLRSSVRFPAVSVMARCALGLLVGQILVGALSAVDSARAGAADLHLAVASALWSLLVALVTVDSVGGSDRATGVAALAPPTTSARGDVLR